MAHNKKSKFNSIISITYSILALSIVLAGCESPKEKREREAEEKREAIQNRREAATRIRQTNEAKSDYSNTLHAYQGVAGDYNGAYAVQRERRTDIANVRIRATVAGAATPSQLDLADTESEVRTFREALSLNIELTEHNNSNGNRLVYCAIPGVKPDFGAGLLRLSCSGTSGGAARVYEILFERSEAYSSTLATTGTMSLSELAQLSARASEISSLLIAGRLNSIDALNMRIEAPAAVFRGQLIRIQSSNR